MKMGWQFNDSPVEIPEEDQYAIHPFACALAKSIREISKPVGTAIAVNGPWGSGKSSVINLVRYELGEEADDKLEISEFKCWWYRGEEALALAFLQNLHSVLGRTLQDKVKDLIPQLGRRLLQAAPVVGAGLALTPAGPLAGLAGASMNFAKRFFPEGETLEDTFQKLESVLSDQDKRFLIIIDDIDRLNPEEAIAIFRIIKSVGRLPNVLYLLAFDRELADQSIEERFPSEGPHYLEKIIQASFELPSPVQSDLNKSVLDSVEEICGAPISQEEIAEFLNMFYDAVAPYIETPRHAVRFRNAISVTWPAISSEVRLADFVALETLRLYEPSLFRSIRSSKVSLCGERGELDRTEVNDDSRFDRYLVGIPSERHETAKLALQRLFPRLERMGYSRETQTYWDAERRVCISAHFDTYFRLSLGEEVLPIDHIDEMASRAGEKGYIQKVFLDAAKKRRRNGSSLVPVLLDELNTHASKIVKSDVRPFLVALFEIHDDIDLRIDEERGVFSIGDTTLRYHWLIRRLTEGRFDLDERTELYSIALESSCLGWMVNFVRSAEDQHQVRGKGPLAPEQCLVRKDALDGLIDLALNSIRSSAADGSLLEHRDLISILYCWRGFAGNDPAEVRAWVDPLMDDHQALVTLARHFTGESWTQGMGLGDLTDHVSRRNIRVQIDESTDIVDTHVFRAALEEMVQSGDLNDEDQQAVAEFLSVWASQVEESS